MEANEDIAYSSILERAADLLTPYTWNKGLIFQKKRGTGPFRMCAHGAVRTVAEPRRFITKQTFIKEIEKDLDRAYGARFNLLSSKRGKLEQRWFIRSSSLQGYANLHYLMIMAGLTTTFNDSKTTTLRMVKAKLRKTAQLARELGV